MHISVVCSALHQSYGFYAAFEHVTLNFIRKFAYLCTHEDDIANIETWRDNDEFKPIPRTCWNWLYFYTKQIKFLRNQHKKKKEHTIFSGKDFFFRDRVINLHSSLPPSLFFELMALSLIAAYSTSVRNVVT